MINISQVRRNDKRNKLLFKLICEHSKQNWKYIKERILNKIDKFSFAEFKKALKSLFKRKKKMLKKNKEIFHLQTCETYDKRLFAKANKMRIWKCRDK